MNVSRFGVVALMMIASDFQCRLVSNFGESILGDLHFTDTLWKSLYLYASKIKQK